jgi:hypothetical protein
MSDQGASAGPRTAVEEREGSPVAVRVEPAVMHGVTTVSKIGISLAAAVGELEGEQRVLLPFLDCAVYGSHGDADLLWVGRLAMDNVAFLLEQVSIGLADTLEPLNSMAQGDLKPPPGRLSYAADRVASAGESLREAAAQLRSIASRKL